jgi:thiamine biosynthesis protein ThiS
MRVSINGEPTDIGDGVTLAKLVADLALDPRRIAVERNRRLVRRGEHAGTVLADGDVLEIVTLVGGG